jgi:hypothetical protein
LIASKIIPAAAGIFLGKKIGDPQVADLFVKKPA